MGINKKLFTAGEAPLVPSENFNTVLYTGNQTARSITGFDFTPDLVWIKSRNETNLHVLTDSVRGTNKQLFSNQADAESTSTDRLTAFNANGFSIAAGSSFYRVNKNSINYAAWSWKAGGATSTPNVAGVAAVPTAGSVKINGANSTTALSGSIAVTNISANTAAGFSIVQYTGNTTSGATIDHGLGGIPELAFFKNIPNTAGNYNWSVYSGENGPTGLLYLNDTAAFTTTASRFNDTSPTDTVFTLGNDDTINKTGESNIAYCFKSIAGYSKIGTYTGTGNVNNQITTGFEVAFLLIKNSSNTGYWQIFDNARNPNNQIWNALYPNDSGAEGGDFLYTYVNFSSNGFIINDPGVFTGDTNMNVAGDTYIYYAVAADKSSTPALAKSFDVNTYAGNGTNKAIINGAKDSFPQSASYNGTGVYNAGGTANISIPGLGGSYYDSAFSISLWFLTPMRHAGSAGYLISGAGSRDFFINIDDDGTGLINGRFYSGSLLYSITTSFNLNTWYNIVFTYSGNGVAGGMKLYANNVLRTSSAYNSGGQTLAGNDSIGGAGAIRNDLNANMCQVRYFDKELSASEVTTVYNETTTAGTLDVLGDGSCVRLYRLNGDASVIDSSGTQSWSWVDDLRSVSAQLRSNTTTDQTRSLGYYQKALYENGLSVGDNSTGDYGVNGGPNSTYGDTYVTYNFKAGGLSKIDDISVSGATIQSNYSANGIRARDGNF